MIKSMTGYGRDTQVLNQKEISVELKSVNHRFLETNIKMPRNMFFMEDKLKKVISQSVARGKVDVYINISNTAQTTDYIISINEGLAKQYIDALRNFGQKEQLRDDISTMSITRFNDIFVQTKEEIDEDSFYVDVSKVLGVALNNFVTMRQNEGESLEKDLLLCLDNIEQLVEKIVVHMPLVIKQYEERLYKKLNELLENKDIDSQRIITETAVFADKVAVDEEMTRLKSHIKQFRKILKEDKPVGKKLDFLTQELVREANTTTSKVTDINVTNLVVEMKANIEKIKEQIQNVE